MRLLAILLVSCAALVAAQDYSQLYATTSYATAPATYQLPVQQYTSLDALSSLGVALPSFSYGVPAFGSSPDAISSQQHVTVDLPSLSSFQVGNPHHVTIESNPHVGIATIAATIPSQVTYQQMPALVQETTTIQAAPVFSATSFSGQQWGQLLGGSGLTSTVFGVGSAGKASFGFTDTKVAAPIQATPIINKQHIAQPIYRPHLISQPIIQPRVIEQPILRRHLVEQPIIRQIITQPIIQPQIQDQTTVKSKLVEQPIVQPRVIDQTFVQPKLIEQPVQNAPVQAAATVSSTKNYAQGSTELAPPQQIQIPIESATKSHGATPIVSAPVTVQAPAKLL